MSARRIKAGGLSQRQATEEKSLHAASLATRAAAVSRPGGLLPDTINNSVCARWKLPIVSFVIANYTSATISNNNDPLIFEQCHPLRIKAGPRTPRNKTRTQVFLCFSHRGGSTLTPTGGRLQTERSFTPEPTLNKAKQRWRCAY